ncbi:MAG: peptidoglycan DD-metalloendopeptidase family protein [Woeseiaceae bacterium]
MAKRQLAVLALAALLIAACSAPRSWESRDSHIVRSGETLFSISWRYGVDPADVARWNRLGDGSLIYPGQVLQLTGPSGRASSASSTTQTRKKPPQPLPTVPAQPSPAWSWPTAGKIDVGFGGKPGSGTGVLINGKAGQPVRAAAAGRVVYAGNGLIGYGQLIIVKHNETYLSAYGYNKALLVKEGQDIKKGQQIATMGEGPENKPRLHFEIRRNGKPVDPRPQLSPR